MHATNSGQMPRRWRRALLATAALLGSSLAGLGGLATAAAAPAAAAAAAAPDCTVSATLVNPCRPWLGAESGGYGPTGFKAAMQEHEQRIGRQLDIVHEYLGTGNITLTPDIISLANRPNTIVLVNWLLSTHWSDATGGNATVNKQIDNMAKSIKSLGSTKILMTVHHEPENDISAGGDPSCPGTKFTGHDGTAADYVAMWHNVRSRFDALGVDNVVWVMNYMGWKAWDCVIPDLWPGNDLVDWVTWDPYMRTATWTDGVGYFYKLITRTSDATHDYLSKTWGLSEFGYLGPSQKAAYAMYDEAAKDLHDNVFPKLKAYVVWDQHTASSSDVRVGYDSNGVADPVEQQHYNAFANDPMLTGDGTGTPGDTTPPSATLSAPADASNVSGTVAVAGSASDDTGVTSVALLVDGTSVTSKAPAGDGSVSFSWDSTTVGNGTHTLRLRASDAAGNTGLSNQVTVTVGNTTTGGDTSPPTAPILSANRSGYAVQLSWTGASDDTGVTGYTVYRGTTAIATTSSSTYTDTGAPPGKSSSWTVKAMDAAGNTSPSSNSVSATLPSDKTAPSAPSGPKATAGAAGSKQITVSWTASTDNAAVANYYVYRGNSKYRMVAGDVTSLVDTGLTAGTKYTYKVYAIDTAGNWSGSSGNVSATAR